VEFTAHTVSSRPADGPWPFAKDVAVSGSQSLPVPSQVSRQKKKPPHVEKAQAHFSPNYMSEDNILESRSLNKVCSSTSALAG